MIYNVVNNGVCIGCGACAVAVPSIKIEFNRFGDLVAALPPDLSDSEQKLASAVCPFASPINEDDIASKLFSTGMFDREIGYYKDVHAMYSPKCRSNGSSGGVVTWLLSYLLENQLVDSVIHVGRQPESKSDRFFNYTVSTTVEEVFEGSTSFYYPVSMDEVLKIVKEKPGRYAITGVPCFHKALRLLRMQCETIDQRIAFQVGIVCGQMKSAHYLEYLTGHTGVVEPPVNACFRRKVHGLPSNDYAFEVSFVPKKDSIKPSSAIETRQVLNNKIGANWGMGYFKPEACEYCDDVFAETADIAAMDAWLPRYVKDPAGWSLVVVRAPAVQSIVENGISEGLLVTEKISTSDLAESQRGGLNHRHNALPYRLWRNKAKWRPIKRQVASPNYPLILKIEQNARAYLRMASRSNWLTTGHLGDFDKFQRKMRVPELIYKLITKIKRYM